MHLARHTRANAEFFEKGCGPTVHEWADWIRRGVVRGKLVDGKPYVDLNHFAVNDVLAAAPKNDGKVTALDLLRPRKVKQS